MRNLIIGAIFGIVFGAVIGATLIGPQLVEQIPGFNKNRTAIDYSRPSVIPKTSEPVATKEVFKPTTNNTQRDVTEWRMASAYSIDMPELGALAKRIEDDIWQLSDGQFKIQFHGPGSLVAPDQMFDAVRSGTIDAAFTSPAEWTEKIPALGLFSSAPFGPTPREFMAWFYFSGGQKLYQDIYNKQGIHSLICGVSPAEASGWFRRKIDKVADIKDLRMRISGLGAKVMQTLGAQTQKLSDGDVFVAFEAGLLDAAEFSQPSVDLSLGMHKIAQYYYFPGWHQPTTLFELMINLETWERLAPDRKSQLQVMCGDNVRHSLARSEAAQFTALKELVAAGADIQSWPPEVMSALESAWADVVSDESAKDADFNKVWRSLQKFRMEFDIWREISQP